MLCHTAGIPRQKPGLCAETIRYPAEHTRAGPDFSGGYPLSWDYDLFWTSLETYMAVGWGPRLIIIAKSKSRRALNDAKVNLHACLWEA